MKRNHLLVLALGVALLVGCTHMMSPPKTTFTGYTAQSKIPLRVGLNFTPELRAAKWERKSMGDTWVIPMGNSLVQNSETLARHIFNDVIVLSGASPTSGVDAILTPKLAYLNRTTGATSFGKSIVSIKVEWNLTDLSGKPVWLETIGGEGSGSTGWTDPEKIIKAALEDMLIKSQQAFAAASAIQDYANRTKDSR